MTEQWKPIEGFPTYQISDQGRVKGPSGSVLKTQVSGTGREIVQLRHPNTKKNTTRGVEQLTKQHHPEPEFERLHLRAVVEAPLPPKPKRSFFKRIFGGL